MNILPDYFTAIPDDPRTEEIPAIKRQIMELTGQFTQGDEGRNGP